VLTFGEAMEEVVEYMNDSLGSKVMNQIIEIFFHACDLAVLRLVDFVHGNVHLTPKLGQLDRYFLPNNEILRVRMPVHEIQATVD